MGGYDGGGNATVKMTDAFDAVTRELQRHGIPWKTEYRKRHIGVIYLGQTQIIPCTSRSERGIMNARAFTRRIIRKTHANVR